MMQHDYVVFDLESVAISDVDQWIAPGEAPSNYKDPLKIAAYIAEERVKRIEKAAVDVDLARILCAGIQTSNHPPIIILAGWTDDGELTDETERGLITTVLSLLIAETVVGFHIAFDIPLLLRRAQLLGIPAGELPRFLYSKYSPSKLVWPMTGYATRVVDLEHVLTFNYAVSGKSLDWYSRRFGCPIEDAFHGTEIAALWQARELSSIEGHCRADIARTQWLAERVGVIDTAPVSLMVEGAPV